jgi:hypothetical protein
MSISSESSNRELIARLCDGEMSSIDMDRLGKTLSADPLLQHECLDQLLIQGLLQYEYGLVEPGTFGCENDAHVDGDHEISDTRPAVGAAEFEATSHGIGRNRLPGWKELGFQALGFSLLLTVLAVGWWRLRPQPKIDVAIPLVDASFENASLVTFHPQANGWYGDEALVVRENRTNRAHDGEHMLQLVRSLREPAGEWEIYQAFDLRQLQAVGSDRSPAELEASVAFNACGAAIGKSYVFGLQLYATSAPLSEQELVSPETGTRELLTARRYITADWDAGSWQEIRLVMPLNRDAAFGLVKISVRNSDSADNKEIPEVFVDNVQVRVKSQGVL